MTSEADRCRSREPADPEALFRDLSGLMSVESAALCELLEMCEKREASVAVADVAELCTCNIRDEYRLEALLVMVFETLESISCEALDGAARPPQAAENLHGAVNWYGRQIADILCRFRS